MMPFKTLRKFFIKKKKLGRSADLRLVSPFNAQYKSYNMNVNDYTCILHKCPRYGE